MSKKNTPAIFKYYYNGEGYFPAIPLYVSAGGKKLKFHALIDSGATISVFKDEIAEQLGIAIENGKETYLGGVGGRIKGYVHKLEIEIAGKKFICPVVFSHEYLVSFNLLGREAFFKQFRIVFEEKKNLLELE
ncbi:MAG: retroviral-like aspartic protease family protein [Patescibacteria group bacterium]|nr:retroviral-like aspartic protease family protein [Patescibacteria group bacterium]